MITKKGLENRIRGWFPSDVKLSQAEKTKNKGKLFKRTAPPFSEMGGLVIIASILSATMGIILVSAYQTIHSGPGHIVFYTGLYVGILSVAASAISLLAGIMFLLEKRVSIAAISMVIVLFFGLATILLPILEGLPWYSGLLVASPMVASSVAALILFGVNKYMNLRKSGIVATRERLPAGLGIAASGLTVLGILLYFAPIYPKTYLGPLIVGILLFMGTFLAKRAYKQKKA